VHLIGIQYFAKTKSELQYFKNLISIGSREFYLCGLSSITIPNSVTTIGDRAFEGCSITMVISEILTPFDVNAFDSFDAILVVPKGSRAYYKNVSGWGFIFIYEEGETIIDREQTDEQGLYYTLRQADDASFYYSVTGHSDEMNSEIVIPADLGGCPVRVVEANAFNGCTSLSSITIPNSMTSIGRSAFSGCTSLSYITIPNSVTSIGEGAFNYSGLTSIHLFDLAAYCQIAFGDYPFPAHNLFLNGEEITDLAIPDGVTSISDYAFANCVSLSSVTIPNSVTRIGDCAFYEAGLTSVNIPNSVTTIGDCAFYEAGLTSVNIPNSVTTIGDGAFSHCSNLISIKIGNGVRSIGKGAFASCMNLASVKIGNNVISIGANAFEGCTGLTSIKLPNLLENIGAGAFQYTSLATVYIPESVKSIGNAAFEGCGSLVSVSFGGGNTSIGDFAFDGCRNLASVSLEDGITSIGAGAFASCAFSSIIIPNSVTTIGASAFQDCSGLTSVMIGSGVTSLESATFQGCSSLTTISIPNSVASIADGYNNRVYRNGKYYYTKGGVFYGCSNLTSVTIGSGVMHIGSYAFLDCSKLSSIKMGENVNSIGDGAFSNCSNLTSIILPNTLDSIGENVFPVSMISIEIPNSFTDIPDNLFRNNNFQYIKLGNNVKNIGMNAFGSSNPVIEIETTTPPTIDKDAFPNVSYLNNINVIVTDSKAETAYRKAAVWKDMTFSNQNNIAEVTVDTPGDLSWELVDECNMMPAKVVGLKVNGSINDEDFAQILVNMKSLLRLDLSDCNITAIPDNALKGKTQLQELILPTKLRTIGQSAFQNCTSLKELTTQNELQIIGQSAFQNCTSLKELTMKSGLQTIGQSAFQNCTSLKKLTLVTGLQAIEQNAFYNCISLIGELSLPTTVTTIGISAFVGTSYTSVKMPSALKTIGDNAFYNVALKQPLVLPNKVTSIGASAFAGTKITGLTIPNSVKSIGDYSFANTPIQGHVTIPDGVTYLGKGVFHGSQLSTVFLPNSVTTLNEGLFQDCPNLNMVYVPDNFTGVAGSAFDGCGALRILRLSANLTSMGENTFLNTPLEYIKIPSQVEALPKGVLKNCKNLESLSLPANLKTVEGEALTGCTALRNLSIEALDPPVIKDMSAINGINTDLCLISVPTQSYRKYVLAEYWGQFVQMRNDIAVETEGAGEIAFESVNEEEDEEEQEVKARNRIQAISRARRNVPQLASEEESMTYANNGSTVYVPQQGKVRFYIIPAEGEGILSATLDGVDIMPDIVDGVYTATADKRKAKLVVKFSGTGGNAVLAGDVNGDGKVSITDAVYVVNYVLQQPAADFQEKAADLNGDGKITITDAVQIVNIILGQGNNVKARLMDPQ